MTKVREEMAKLHKKHDDELKEFMKSKGIKLKFMIPAPPPPPPLPGGLGRLPAGNMLSPLNFATLPNTIASQLVSSCPSVSSSGDLLESTKFPTSSPKSKPKLLMGDQTSTKDIQNVQSHYKLTDSGGKSSPVGDDLVKPSESSSTTSTQQLDTDCLVSRTDSSESGDGTDQKLDTFSGIKSPDYNLGEGEESDAKVVGSASHSRKTSTDMSSFPGGPGMGNQQPKQQSVSQLSAQQLQYLYQQQQYQQQPFFYPSFQFSGGGQILPTSVQAQVPSNFPQGSSLYLPSSNFMPMGFSQLQNNPYSQYPLVPGMNYTSTQTSTTQATPTQAKQDSSN